MAPDPLNQAQGEDGFIKMSNIEVVPDFKTNDKLEQLICRELNMRLKKKKGVIEAQPLASSQQGPTFLVFRPTARAGDEFTAYVTPRLIKGSPKYLIIASSTKPTDTFSISDDDEKRLRRHKTRIVIKHGRLVASSDSYHNYNSDSLRKLAEAICDDYSNCVEICTQKDSCISNQDDSSSKKSLFCC